MGIVRPEAYRVLSELSSRGLVTRNLGSPSTYIAAAPARAVTLLLEGLANRLSALEQKKMPLIKSLSSYASGLGNGKNERFSLATGGDNVIVRVREMITDAKFFYAGIISKYAFKRIRDVGIASALGSAIRRNVRVRVISEIDATNRRSADYLSRFVELPRTRDVYFYVDIVDKKQMLFGPAVTDEEASPRNAREMDLLTNNARVIQGMYALFDQLWKGCRTYTPTKARPTRPPI